MGKGGGGARTPYEAAESGRSKQAVKITEMISEGEIFGLADGLKSVYLDNTPVQNADGSFNFSNVDLQGRVGSQVQTAIVGFDATEKEISVGTQVKKNRPLTRTVTDGKVTRLRLTLGVQSLVSQNDQGDTHGTSVDFQVTIGRQVYHHRIEGKYSGQYLRQFVYDNLPPVPFHIKMERLTPDSQSQRLQNNTVWASYTEIIDTELTYPNTALIGIQFDSEYFSNIPNRTYDIKGIKLQVPSNYDPDTRTYTGLWDGTFKLAWSDNPAWVLYDIITNTRYGLGQRLGGFGADKWALYHAAQYCDQRVPDGFGGKEPRFTCNAWLTEQRSAYDVINDICSIFRAMPIWNGQELTVILDRPADPVWTYTNANVENGEFEYGFSAKKARHNAVQVEYADKDNAYEKTVEYVSDDAEIRRHGLNVKKVTAFGCTSRGQAFRTGKHLLETEKRETKTVSFTVGSEGLMHLPGDIIRIADTRYAGTNIGGRVLDIDQSAVVLDREIDINGESYFYYINHQAKHRRIRILAADGPRIQLAEPPQGLEKYAVWSLQTAQLDVQLFRALTVKEESGKYHIFALQHEPQKEAIVDNGAVFEGRQTTQHQTPKIEHLGMHLDGGNLQVNWQTGAGMIVGGGLRYDVKILKNGQLYALHKGVTTLELAFNDLPDGEYQFIVQAKNAQGQLIDEKAQRFFVDRPPRPRNVGISAGLTDVNLFWEYVDETTFTEIWASATDDLRTAERTAKVLANNYSHTVGAKTTAYYWLRHVRGKNFGAFYRQQGLKAQTAVNIDEELRVLNEKLGQNIIDQVFDTAAPARNLEMLKTVDGLDKTHFLGYKQVYNIADGKVYVCNGSQYSENEADISRIPAKNIVGQLTDEQLAGLNAAKLAGKLSSNQIQSIQASQISGTVQVSQLAAIPTTKLSGTLQAAQIAANAIGTNHLAAGSITTAKIAAAAVTANQLAAASVVADKLAANSVTAAKIQAQAIGATHLAAKAVTADKLAANSVTAGAIQAGAIRANHVAAGELTAEKLAIGLGGNLLYNPIFANQGWGWRDANAKGGDWSNCPNTSAVERTYHKNDYHPKGEQTEAWRLIQITGSQEQFNTLADRGAWVDVCRQFVNVVAGKWYMVSAYVGALNCAGTLVVEKYNADETQYQGVVAKTPIAGHHSVHNKPANFITANSSHFAKGLQQGATRIWVKFKAPETGKILLLMRINTYTKNVTYGDFYFARPMLQECTEHTTQPNEWQNAGVTAIHGGSIVTRTITAQHITAGTITGNEIVAGTIAAKHLAAGSVNAGHIASRSISTDKLNVSSLSAISVNLGVITSGSLNINNRFKVNNDGRVEMRSQSANVGMIMNNDQIIVYDERGRVRVKIGRLS